MDPSKESLTQNFNELHDVLDRMVRVYRLLLDSVRKERELLIEVNVSELDINNEAKNAALKKLRRLENERVRVVRLLAEHLNLKDEPVKLLDLAAAVNNNANLAEGLRKKHAVLELLVQRVIENNKKNENLAQSALKNVSGALDIIRESTQEKPTYERKGAMKNQGQAGNLVKRQV